MLDPKIQREKPDLVRQAMSRRGTAFDMESLLRCDERRRRLIQESERLKNQRNELSDEIAKLRRSGASAEDKIASQRELGRAIGGLEQDLRTAEKEWDDMIMVIPNMPHETVPEGSGEDDNKIVRTWGEKPAFDFAARPHWEIGESLDILDFKRAAKLTGSRFVVYKGYGALLERALINFMLDLHTLKHGYTEMLPPIMVNRESMTGTGQLPKFEEELFKIQGFDWFLIPTAEVPVTNVYRDEILKESDLPIKYCAYTPCFRAEAGAHGKDTRGLTRQHQFNKVELVKFTSPETSYEELEGLLSDAEDILKELGIHYRVSALCTGDLGFSSAKTYDIEVWLPGQNIYREISSCSNFEAFQARRAAIRFRKGTGKTDFVHTLNGSGLAVGRTVMAVMENYQTADGLIRVPEKLMPYMRGLATFP